MVREGLLEKVAFEKSLNGDERGSLVDMWEQSVPERRNSQCKGPEIRV